MQATSYLDGKDGKNGVIITSHSGDRVCLDWYAYDSKGKLITGGDGPAFHADELEVKFKAAKAECLKAIG